MAVAISPVSSIDASDPLSASSHAPATTTSTASKQLATITADRRPSASASASDPASTVTSASASASASATPTSQPDKTSSSQAHRRPTRPTSSEFLSDKATAALIRRSLCAHHLTDRGRGSPVPIQDLLPPLTSRNDVDLQLYAFISIILREFVQNWYNKITPDETFVAEIVQVIAHCTRSLEQRLRKVDLESLLFDELPELLATHISAYRTAIRPNTKPPLQTELHQIYHSLCPLPALSPVPQPSDQASIRAQADNESAYRQLLVHGVLAVLLPTEDLENECLTSLIGQILSELVIGNLVAGKLSEPWLIWEILIIIVRLIHRRNDSEDPDILPDETATTARDPSSIGDSAIKTKQSWSFHQIFWSLVHVVFLVVGMIRLVFSVGALSRSLPPRPDPSVIRVLQVEEPDSTSHDAGDNTHKQPTRTAVIDFHIWRCMGDILEVEARMPWLQGVLSMLQLIALEGPGRVGAFNGTLDRLMSHYIHIHVLDPAHLPPLLRAIRAALFPNNAPGVSNLKPPSSGEQLAALRRRCASALLGVLPKAVGELYYGTNNWASSGVKADTMISESMNLRAGPPKNNSAHNIRGSTDAGPPHVPSHKNNPMMRNDATLSSQPKEPSQEPNELHQPLSEAVNEEEERRLTEIDTSIVDIFSDAYCNKHLIYGVLELVLTRLVPELVEKGVGELWEERLH
ncbi:PXA domain-containing protein [Xylaria digitata]|nr:PXA domain-containing protein [Xylaria digitata]